MPGTGLSPLIISFNSNLMYVSLLYSEKNEAREVKQLDQCHKARTRVRIPSVQWTHGIMQPLSLFLNHFISRQVKLPLFSEGHQSWLQKAVLFPSSAWVSGSPSSSTSQIGPKVTFTSTAGLSLSNSGSSPRCENLLACTPCVYLSFDETLALEPKNTLQP